MRDFTFSLFGIDFLPSENCYGIYVGGIDMVFDQSDRHVLCLYYADGVWSIDILFFWFLVS